MSATVLPSRLMKGSFRSLLLIFCCTLLPYDVLLGHRQGISFAKGLEVAKDALLSTTSAFDPQDHTPPVPVSPLTQNVVVSHTFLKNATSATAELTAAPGAEPRDTSSHSAVPQLNSVGVLTATFPPAKRAEDVTAFATLGFDKNGNSTNNSSSRLPVGRSGHQEHPGGAKLLRHAESEPELSSIGRRSREPQAASADASSSSSPSRRKEPEVLPGVELIQEDTPHSRKARAVVQNVVVPWPCRLAPGKSGKLCPEDSTTEGYFYIPIERSCETFHNDVAEASFVWATRYIESQTRIRFIKRTDEEKYLELTCRPTYCFASVGSGLESPVINIFPPLCPHPGSILHELLHVLGISHEHNRPERNRYISVNTLKAVRDFKMQTDVTTYGSYDFASLMHYARHPGRSLSEENPFVPINRTFAFLADYPKVFPSDCDWLALESLYPGSAPGKTQCQPNCVYTLLKPTAACLKTDKKVSCEIWCAAGHDIFFGDGKCEPSNTAKNAKGAPDTIRYKKSPTFTLPATKRPACVPYAVLYERWRSMLLDLEGSARSLDAEGQDDEEEEEEEEDEGPLTPKATIASLCPQVMPSLKRRTARRACKARCEQCVKRAYKAFSEEAGGEEDETDADKEQWDPAPAVRKCVSMFSKPKSYICVWSGAPHFAVGMSLWWSLPLLGAFLLSSRHWR